MKTESKIPEPQPCEGEPAPYGAEPPYTKEFLSTPAQRHEHWMRCYCAALSGLCSQIKPYVAREYRNDAHIEEEYERYDEVVQTARVIATNAFREMEVAVGEHEDRARDEVAVFNAQLNAKANGH